MSELNMTIDGGACRFMTKVKATPSDDYMSVTFVIESECPSVKKLAAALGECDAMDAVASRIIDNILMKKCSEFLPHPACIVPCALVKAAEAACDLALKKDAGIHFER